MAASADQLMCTRPEYLDSLATEYLGSLAMLPLLDVNTCICFNSLSNLAFYYAAQKYTAAVSIFIHSGSFDFLPLRTFSGSLHDRTISL